MAKYHWFPVDQATEKKTRLSWFALGQGYAEQAVKADPKNINAHLWLAALIGDTGRGFLYVLPE